LLATEGVKIAFSDDGIQAIADAAWQVNETTENIGARRLHTMMERLTEELSFHADERSGETIQIDKSFVNNILSEVVKDEDLSRFIL
jgi:ATP-dependent HslUV protease ATP-binding subunit HslU